MPHSSNNSLPRFISLNRLAHLCGRSRVTLLLRLKDGDLPPDALLDVGRGQDPPALPR